jgi:hypothetical protein
VHFSFSNREVDTAQNRGAVGFYVEIAQFKKGLGHGPEPTGGDLKTDR